MSKSLAADSLLLVRTADRTTKEEIVQLVEELDRPVPQVILEMKILQLDVGDGLSIGTSWASNKGREFFDVAERDPTTGQPTAFDFIGTQHNLGLGRFATGAAATFAYEYISGELRAGVESLPVGSRSQSTWPLVPQKSMCSLT